MRKTKYFLYILNCEWFLLFEQHVQYCSQYSTVEMAVSAHPKKMNGGEMPKIRMTLCCSISSEITSHNAIHNMNSSCHKSTQQSGKMKSSQEPQNAHGIRVNILMNSYVTETHILTPSDLIPNILLVLWEIF